MTRPDMSVRYSAARFLERVATGRRTLRMWGGGWLGCWLVWAGRGRQGSARLGSAKFGCLVCATSFSLTVTARCHGPCVFVCERECVCAR